MRKRDEHRRPRRAAGIRGPSRWIGPWALTLTLLTALPAAVAGQQAAEKMARIRSAYPPPAVERITVILRDARSRGLPAGPVLDKALEGAAKRVPAARVLPALEAYVQRLGAARDALGPDSRPAWIVAGADALRRGVAAEDLGRVRREAGARTPMALVVVGDLVDAGVPGERALEVLGEALRRTPDERRLLDVPATVRHLMRRGSAPTDAARRVLRAMRDGTPLHRLRGGPFLDAAPGLRSRPVPPGSEPIVDRLRDGRDGGG